MATQKLQALAYRNDTQNYFYRNHITFRSQTEYIQLARICYSSPDQSVYLCGSLAEAKQYIDWLKYAKVGKILMKLWVKNFC